MPLQLTQCNLLVSHTQADAAAAAEDKEVTSSIFSGDFWVLTTEIGIFTVYTRMLAFSFLLTTDY